MLTWTDYCAWRRTKCPEPDPRVVPGVPLAPGALDELGPLVRTEDQVHAALEFLGELGELGTLLLDRGWGGFSVEDRHAIIDEIGDVFFCGCWVLDAYGSLLLERMPRLELLDSDDSDIVPGRGDMERIKTEVLRAFLAASLIANGIKKRRYHGVDIDLFDDRCRVMFVFVVLNRLLLCLGSSIEEALLSNQVKLERRYPGGFSVGGGVRDGVSGVATSSGSG